MGGVENIKLYAGWGRSFRFSARATWSGAKLDFRAWESRFTSSVSAICHDAWRGRGYSPPACRHRHHPTGRLRAPELSSSGGARGVTGPGVLGPWRLG